MKKILLLIALSAVFFHSEAQVDKVRAEFFDQIIGEEQAQHAKYKVWFKVRGDREAWDTTGDVYLHYFTHCDTTDKSDLSLRNRETRKKIRTLARALTDQDYADIKAQIINQYKDDFYPKQLVQKKPKGKIKEATTTMYSQPLIVAGGNLIFLIAESRGQGFGATRYTCYKRVNGKWIEYLILYRTGWAS
ncbi:MAG: hypothetical protein JSS79_11725 [Bacteroidetes bacterium]|nr:hypothetical protein [Bacteroidota bacterium]